VAAEGDNSRPTTARLTTPLTGADLRPLNVGDVVFIDGVVFTGREGVYRQVFDRGLELPLDAADRTVTFHCSPAVAETAPGAFRISAVTATASFRFARYMPRLFDELGVRVVIGKGGMSPEVYEQAFKPRGAVYLTTVGYGLGATYGRAVTAVRDVFWKDALGLAQALWVLEVRRFGPFLVECDAAGRSLFADHNRRINDTLARLYENRRPPTLKRLGETADPGDEML